MNEFAGCRPEQKPWGFFCKNPNGSTEPIHVCLDGETLRDGICLPPPHTCYVGQVQVGVTCIDVPAHTIAIPINSCGVDISFAAALLIVRVLQCRE